MKTVRKLTFSTKEVLDALQAMYPDTCGNDEDLLIQVRTGSSSCWEKKLNEDCIVIEFPPVLEELPTK